MGHFYYEPKKFNDKAVGFYLKIAGYSLKTGKPLTLWSNKIYPSANHVLNCFVQTVPYYFSTEKKIVCCAYTPCGEYQFSFMRDQKTGKFNKIDDSVSKVPVYMGDYQRSFK